MIDIIVLNTSAEDARQALGIAGDVTGRLGWTCGQVEIIDLTTAPPETLRPRLAPGRRMLLLCDPENAVDRIAAELAAAGWAGATITMLTGPSGGDDAVASDSSEPATSSAEPGFSVLAVELSTTGVAVGTVPGLPDSSFDNDGQLTKREIRAIALADLRPLPGQLMWDLGAGAGSVGIEWALQHRGNRTISVERNPERAERIRANALRLGVDRLEVHNGSSIDLLTELPSPDAVFIGGGCTIDLLDEVYSRLRPAGRLVVHTVTLESDSLLVEARARYGGTLRRISVERAEPLGRYLSWTPARAVTHWATTKPVMD